MALIWTPSPLAVANGRNSRVVYRNGPLARDLPVSAHDAQGYMLEPLPGTKLLARLVAEKFDVRTVYMHRRREVHRDSAVDLHVAGRAIDFMTYENHEKAFAIADYLVEHNEPLGIQFVVTWHTRWSAGKANPRDKFGLYKGPNPHTDHPHVELTPESAAGSLEWYKKGAIP